MVRAGGRPAPSRAPAAGGAVAARRCLPGGSVRSPGRAAVYS